MAPNSAACKADKAAGQITYITPFGYSGSPGIIDIFEAQHLGYFKDLCLNVSINATAYNPQNLVGADTAQASSTSGAINLMTYDQEGGNRLYGVETVGTFSPESIVLRSSCKNLTCLEGGTLGYYNDIDPTVVAMLKAQHVNISQVKFVPLTNRDPITALHEVTGVVSFVGSQDITLKAAHVPFKEVEAQNIGVASTTNVMFMNKTFVKENPVAAANFIRATIKALGYCIANDKQSTDCITYLSDQADSAGDSSSFGLTLNQPVWNFQRSTTLHYGTKPLGTFSAGSKAATLTNKAYAVMTADLAEADTLSGVTTTHVTVPAESSMWDPSIVAGLYKNGTLVWP